MRDLCSSLARERQNVWSWWHLLFVGVLGALVFPGVPRSMGLQDRDLLIIGRAVAPVVAILLAPRTILLDRMAGAIELVAQSAKGLPRVWLVRFGLMLAWCTAALLVFMLPLELRVSSRYGLVWEAVASVVDIWLFAAVTSLVAYRTGSEPAGILGGLVVWFGGVLLGISPPPGMAWLGRMTPLSPYVFGPVSGLVANRVGWAAVTVVVMVVLMRVLRQPEGLLAGKG